MKNTLTTLVAVLLIAGAAAAQQPATRSTAGKSNRTTRTTANGAPQVNETAGANTTQEQNGAINTAGDNAMPTTTDARSSTMTSAGSVKAKKKVVKKKTT